MNEKDFQTLLHFNFLTPTLLIEQIKEDLKVKQVPNFATLLAKTLKDGFKFHLKGQAINPGGLYCVKLSYWLQKYILYATTSENGATLKPAMDILKSFDADINSAIKSYNIIIQKTQSEDEKQRALSRLKAFYDLSFLREMLNLTCENPESFEKDPERLKNFFYRMFERNLIVAPRDINNDTYLESEMAHKLRESFPILKSILKKLGKEATEKLLHEVISKLFVPKLLPNEMFEVDAHEFPMVVLSHDAISLNLDFSTGIMRGQSKLKLSPAEPHKELALSGLEEKGIREQKELAEKSSELLFIERTAPTEFYTQDVVRYFGNNYLVGRYYPDALNRTFEFMFQGTPHRIILDEKGTAHIQMQFQFDQKWHELQYYHEFSPPATIPKHLTGSEYLWWVDAEKTPPETFYVTDKRESPIFLGRLQHEMGETKEAREIKEARETVEIRETEETKQTYEVEELTREGEKTGYILQDLSQDKDKDRESDKERVKDKVREQEKLPDYLTPFLQFEDARFISLLKLRPDLKPNDKIPAIRVLLPRYGLEFYRVGEGPNAEFILKNNPEYRLLQKDLQTILNFNHLIYLEHRTTGKREALIPDQAFVLQKGKPKKSKPSDQESKEAKEAAEETSRLEAEYYQLGLDRANVVPPLAIMSRSSTWDYTGRETYFRIPIQNGKFSPKTTEQCLFLASLYLAKYNPRQAIEALREAYKLGGLKGTEQEIALIRKIMCDIPSTAFEQDMQSQKKARTMDPETITARLTAAWLLAEFKQSHLDTPQFSLSFSPKPEKNDNDKWDNLVANNVREFYKTQFQHEIQGNMNFYLTLKGNVPEDLLLNTEQELTVARQATKEIKTTSHVNKEGKAIWAQASKIGRRWRELELTAYRKEERQLMKAQKQGKIDEAGIKRLEEIRNVLKTGDLFLKRPGKVATVQISLAPELPVLDYQETVLLRDSAELHAKYLSEKKRISELSPSQASIYDSYSGRKLSEMSEDVKDFIPPVKAIDLNDRVPFKQFLAGFNYYYALAVSSREGFEKEQSALIKYIRGVLQMEAEARIYREKNDDESATRQTKTLVSLCNILYYASLNKEGGWPRTKALMGMKDRTEDMFFNLNEFFIGVKDKCVELAESRPITFESLQFWTERAEVRVHVKERSEITALNLSLRSDALEHPKPLAGELGVYGFVRDYKLAGLGKDEQKEEREKVQLRILDTKSMQEPFFQNESQFFEEDLKAGRKINQSRRDQYEMTIKKFTDPKVRKKLLNEIISLASEGESSLRVEEEVLLKMANQALTGKRAEERIRLQIAGLRRHPLKLSDLLTLYIQNDLALLKRKTHLQEEDVIKLYQAIHQFLLNKTANQQRVRVKKALEAAALLQERDKDFYPALHQIGEKLAETRSFNPEKHPMLLAFESCEDILIRPTQAETLEKMLQETPTGYQNMVAQLIMGGGKSKVLLPMLALKKANGSNLSIIEVPAALFETNVADLQATTQKFFGKPAHRFTFSRDSSCNPEDLEALYQKFKQIINNLEYLVTTAESVQALELKYWELLESLSIRLHSKELPPLSPEQRKAREAEIKALENLLKLFKNQGDVLIDEVDSNLDTKKELNYTLGDSVPIQEEELKTLLDIYNIFQDVDLHLSTGNTTLHQVMLGKVVVAQKSDWDIVFQNLSAFFVNDPKSPIHEFCKGLKTEDKLQLQYYLFHDQFDELPASERPVIEKPKFVEAITDPVLQTKIGLLKGEIEFLKHTLRNKPYEHHGFPKSKKYVESQEVAIPYIANNVPNERSQFGSFYETANYTLQLQFLRKKFSLEVIRDFVAEYHKRANNEVTQTLGLLPFDETEASREFSALTGLALTSVHPTDDLRKFRKLWWNNKPVRDICLFKHVLQKIRHFPNILRSDAVNHASIYRSKQGFTGTPWNFRCFHPDMEFNRTETLGVDGQTFDHLMNKPVKTKVHVATEGSPEDFIQTHLERNPNAKRIHAFIDVGALFKGKSNEDIAMLLCLSLLKQGRADIHHVLYFNEKNILCAIPVNFLDKLSKSEADKFAQGQLTLLDLKRNAAIQGIEIGFQ